jgi:hypothetical protein
MFREQVSVASQLSFLAAKDARAAQTLCMLDDVDLFITRRNRKVPADTDTAAANKASDQPLSVQHANDLEPEDIGASQGTKDADEHKLPLVHLPDMLQTLSSLVLPLLPQLWEYFPSNERVQVSGDKAKRIVSVNSFGREKGKRQGLFDSGTVVYPLISLINHSDHPNVRFLHQSEANEKQVSKQIGRHLAILVATRPIRPGDELLICYSLDRKILSQKWGIGDVLP